jgi:ribose/xylose/arabinose/galactoside ABC-type transport system permease subunit
MAFQLPEFGLFTLAMLVVIITGGINLSIITTAGLVGIVSCSAMNSFYSANYNAWLAITLALAIGFILSLACGALNGFFTAIVGVSPILVTLGTMTLFDGISQNITSGRAISGFPKEYFVFGSRSLFGIPIPMLIFITIAIVLIVILEYTPWGKKVYMVGCNKKATEFSGINADRILFQVYIVSAMLCFVASVIMTSRYNSAKMNYGSSYLMQSVAASVLGAADINGGYGKVVGAFLAVCTLQVLSNGLNIFGINRYFVDIIVGLILILTLTLGFINENKESIQRSDAKEAKVV